MNKEQELTINRLGKILRFFEYNVKPDLVFNAGYFDGKGQSIMSRTQEDSTKPNNKIVKNYCSSIVRNFQGYLTGQPITYTSKDGEDVSPLLDVLKDNDYVNADSE